MADRAWSFNICILTCKHQQNCSSNMTRHNFILADSAHLELVERTLLVRHYKSLSQDQRWSSAGDMNDPLQEQSTTNSTGEKSVPSQARRMGRFFWLWWPLYHIRLLPHWEGASKHSLSRSLFFRTNPFFFSSCHHGFRSMQKFTETLFDVVDKEQDREKKKKECKKNRKEMSSKCFHIWRFSSLWT